MPVGLGQGPCLEEKRQDEYGRQPRQYDGQEHEERGGPDPPQVGGEANELVENNDDAQPQGRRQKRLLGLVS